MKKISFVIAILLSTVVLSGQTVYKSSGSKVKKRGSSGTSGFDKHKVLVGGNLGFYGYRQGNQIISSFSITPMAGYQIAKFDHIGLSFGYQYNRIKFLDYYNPVTGERYDYKLKLPSYYVGVWNHLFVIPQIFISTEFQYNFFKYADGTIDPNSGEFNRENGSAPALLLGLGYAGRASMASRNYYAFWINYDVIQDPHSPYYSNNDLIYGLFYKAGFFFGL